MAQVYINGQWVDEYGPGGGGGGGGEGGKPPSERGGANRSGSESVGSNTDPERTTDPRTWPSPGNTEAGAAGAPLPANAAFGWTQGAGQGAGPSVDYSSSGGGSAPRIGRWDENFNLESNPAMQAVLANLQANILPELQSTMSSQGLARSGAAVDATGRTISGAMVPVTQAIMQAELSNKGMDVGQRSTDIGAALQQASQGLQARGQDISAQQAAMQGFQGIDQADVQRLLSAIGADSSIGGKERSIEDSRLGADFAELMRQFGVSQNFQMTPFTGAANMIGSESMTRGK